MYIYKIRSQRQPGVQYAFAHEYVAIVHCGQFRACNQPEAHLTRSPSIGIISRRSFSGSFASSFTNFNSLSNIAVRCVNRAGATGDPVCIPVSTWSSSNVIKGRASEDPGKHALEPWERTRAA